MISILGYTSIKEVTKGSDAIYYSGLMEEKNIPVIIKTRLSNTNMAGAKTQLYKEYDLLQKIKGKGIPKAIAVQDVLNGTALVMENMEGDLLSKCIGVKTLDLPAFLKISIPIVTVLGELHKNNIIYKNINPESIFVNTDTLEVWFVDYRLAARIPEGKSKLLDPDVNLDNLNYISPEYTGRINRDLDYRTDFYSLGMLFYKMLTGVLPFESTDPLEIVHGHLAITPLSPGEINQEIPDAISEIVMKLIAKNPEDRYMTAHSLTEDLKNCFQQLKKIGNIQKFVLGKEDRHEKFLISQTVYGRDKERKQLIDIFETTRDATVEMAVVTGEAGVGKTSLVSEVSKQILGKGGLFITGKFDQYGQDIPFSAFAQAVQSLIKNVLSESEEKLLRWKEEFLSILGTYGQIIIDVIPDLELIIGPQKPVKRLDAIESQNRFNRLMMEFISIFTDPEHPLVIFLDDLQWADKASLKLIENVITDTKLEYLYIIISYRDNEVSGDHPLEGFLRTVTRTGSNIHRIGLKMLNSDDTTQLLAATLRTGQLPISSFVDLVIQKTGGNPFFIQQFLNMLHQDGLIYFNAKRKCWECKLSEIRLLGITENVVELLLKRMDRMSKETQYILMMASCIGSHFDIATLKTVTDWKSDEILKHLMPAIQLDLVLAQSNPVDAFSNQRAEDLAHRSFKFGHDRIRQASYALIEDKERSAIHLKIGWRIYENLTGIEVEDGLYEVLQHLNKGAELIAEQQKKDEVAELNFTAGIKAKVASAFDSASQYFSHGIRFLGKGSWQRNYHLSLRLFEECAEAKFLCGNIEEMKILIDVVLMNTRTVIDRVNVYLTDIGAFISADHRKEALVQAHQILQEFGMDLPENPTQQHAKSILESTVRAITDRPIEDLINLAPMKDPLHIAEMQILKSVIGPAYQVSPEWYIILVCQQITLSVQHGNYLNSAFAYAAFGSILIGYGGDIDMGYRFGQLSQELLKRFDTKELEAKTMLVHNALIHHWKFHVSDTLNNLKAAYQSGLENGDYEFAGYGLGFFCQYAFLVGRPLKEIQKEMVSAIEAVNNIRQKHTDIYVSIVLQAVLNLQGKTDMPWHLKGDVYDEEIMVPVHIKSNDNIALILLNSYKLMFYYLFERYEEAVVCSESALNKVHFGPGIANVSLYNFYDSLCRLELYRNATPETQDKIIQQVKGNQSKLNTWMQHAPMNYSHRFHLVEAELARVQNKHDSALRHYSTAIRHARDSKYINEEALANELAAKFCVEKKYDDLAWMFLYEARAGYARWGAFKKVEQLETKYNEILKINYSPQKGIERSYNSGKYPGEKILDLASLMKASQSISSEIQFDKFLQTMIKIVIENAGAERGLLIFNDEGQFRVKAQGDVSPDGVEIQIVDFTKSDNMPFPNRVINYVIRTKDYLVDNYNVNTGFFKSDPYIQARQPKSILCLPIIHKSELTGLLYLENRLVADVFSSDRIELLRLLTSQIAISLENTKLFEEHKKAEENYRSIFENAIEGIFQSSPDGRFISVNPALAQILGYDSAEDLKQEVSDIGNQLYEMPEYRQHWLDKLIQDGKVADFEVPFRKKDGSIIWVSLNGRGYFDNKGDLKLIEGFGVDITDKKAAIDALRQREEDLRRENIILRSGIKGRYKFGEIIGKSDQMQEIYEIILKAAASDAPVVIYGESGTGKELVARAIHDLSDRKRNDFVPVNCGAIPDNLLESEFFGYRKGAFTGAYTDKKGYLDQAHEGTLFLDELGEINLNFQVKLLRVLEDGSFTPLGWNVVNNSNARVISATSRDLQQAIKDGVMREDFFYRIHIIPIHLPPLRERIEDIPLLIEKFLKTYSRSDDTPPIDGKLFDMFVNYEWPGNVRELQNVIQRYCTLGTLDFFSSQKSTSPISIKQSNDGKARNLSQNYQSLIEDTEKNLFVETLERFKWNRTKSAAHLGIPRRTFYRKLKKYHLI